MGVAPSVFLLDAAGHPILVAPTVHRSMVSANTERDIMDVSKLPSRRRHGADLKA